MINRSIIQNNRSLWIDTGSERLKDIMDVKAQIMGRGTDLGCKASGQPLDGSREMHKTPGSVFSYVTSDIPSCACECSVMNIDRQM